MNTRTVFLKAGAISPCNLMDIKSAPTFLCNQTILIITYKAF